MALKRPLGRPRVTHTGQTSIYRKDEPTRERLEHIVGTLKTQYRYARVSESTAIRIAVRLLAEHLDKRASVTDAAPEFHAVRELILTANAGNEAYLPQRTA